MALPRYPAAGHAVGEESLQARQNCRLHSRSGRREFRVAGSSSLSQLQIHSSRAIEYSHPGLTIYLHYLVHATRLYPLLRPRSRAQALSAPASALLRLFLPSVRPFVRGILQPAEGVAPTLSSRRESAPTACQAL